MKKKQLLLTIACCSFLTITSSCSMTQQTLTTVQSCLTALKGQLIHLNSRLNMLFASSPGTKDSEREDWINYALTHNYPLPTDSSLTNRTLFFQEIMKMTEEAFRALSANEKKGLLSTEMIDGKTIYKVRDNDGNLYQCGYFEELSIGDLRNATQSLEMGPAKGGTISVINGADVAGNFKYALKDIMTNQANPYNKNAVFQVASNFNALELMGHNQSIDNQKISEYPSDFTQGPFASISAAPGLIFRHYFMYHSQPAENYPPNQWGQRDKVSRQVNFLSEISERTWQEAQDHNKPLVVTKAGYADLSQTNRKPTDNDLLKIKIGFHGETQVAYSCLYGSKHFPVTDPTQIINQVFTAAIGFSGGGANSWNDMTEAWEKTILRAAYEGTIRAAAFKGKKRIFLSQVGAGVFAGGREHDIVAWIIDILADMKDFIQKSGLDVVLIAFNELSDLNKKKIEPLVNETGGYIKEGTLVY